MKLWVDGQALQSASAYRGIGRYIIELLKAIVKNYPEISLHISFNAALPFKLIEARNLVNDWIDEDNIHIWHGIAKDGEAISGLSSERLFSEIMLAHHIACINPDIAFSVSPFEGSIDNCVPLLETYGHDFLIASIFYDAIPLRFSDQYLTDTTALKCYKRRLNSYSNFDLSLSISEFANREIRDLIGVENSVTIHAGLSETFSGFLKSQKKATERTPLIQDPYALYVGGFDWRKNVKLIIEAFSLSDATVKDRLSFVIAGDINEPEETALKNQWNASNLNACKLKIIGRVTDEELVNLYHHAEFTVQPSHMEGFGLTALESLACGTPILASNKGALPEVLNGTSCLFDPSNANELSRLIASMGDPKFRKELLQNALNKGKPYSWNRSAKLAVHALKSLLGDPKKTSLSAIERNAITARKVKTLNLDRKFIAQGLSLANLPKKSKGRILVDTTSTTNFNHGTGIQRVVTSIAKNLLKSTDESSEIQLMFCDNRRPFSQVEMNEYNVLKVSRTAKRNPIVFQSNDIILMLDSSWEFHRYHKHFLMSPKLRGSKIYSVLYDMVPVLTPGFCNRGTSIIYSHWLKDALQYSDGFICISKAVADEFYAFLEAIKFPRPMKIGYWHLGANFSQTANLAKSTDDTSDSESEKGNVKNYLMVGTLEPRKGHRLVLKAFSSLWSQGYDYTLTIVGKKGWAVDALIDSIKSHPEYDKKLFWNNSVSDAQLSRIYGSADVLIAASYSEGFGLPIIEAANLNIPVIASDIPVFREVSEGHDVRFFNCGDWKSLSGLIKTYNEISQDAETREGCKKPKLLTWQQSADALLNVVHGRNWYKAYRPEAGTRFDIKHIGDLGHSELISIEDRKHSITLIDGPYPSDQKNHMRCMLKLINSSDVCWSPHGPNGTQIKGVVLSARIKEENNLVDKGIRVPIPLTIIPHVPYYFAIDLPNDSLLAGKTYKIQLLQEGISWWGAGVNVKLNGIAQ